MEISSEPSKDTVTTTKGKTRETEKETTLHDRDEQLSIYYSLHPDEGITSDVDNKIHTNHCDRTSGKAEHIVNH